MTLLDWIMLISVTSYTLAAHRHEYDVADAFPDTCVDYWDCYDIHPHALCRDVIVTTSGSGENATEKRCVCDYSENYHLHNGTCAYHSHVHTRCDVESSVCVDVNTECVEDGTGWGTTRCMCVEGTFKVRDKQGTYVCATILVSSSVPSCTACEAPGGTCYDLDNDGEKDGCLCPASFSGDDCENVHVNVRCSTDTMSVCYAPHAGYNFSRGATLYADTSGDKPQCQGAMREGAPGNHGNRSGGEGTCAPGQVYLSLPLEESKRFTCSTIKQRPDSSTMKYENMLVVEKAEEDATGEDDDYLLFKVYCTYRTHAQAGFKGMKIDSPPDGYSGMSIYPELTFAVETALGESIPQGVSIRSGDKVKYRLFLDTTSGYEAVTVESCMFANDYNLPKDSRLSTPVIRNGCPLASQTLVTQRNTWARVSGHMFDLETGLVEVAPFPSGHVVFLHCTVRLCLRNFVHLCDPVPCGDTTRRRRRAADQPEVDHARMRVRREAPPEEERLLSVAVGVSVWSQADFFTSEDGNIAGYGSSDRVDVSPGAVTTAAIIGSLMATCLLVLLVVIIRSKTESPDEDEAGLYAGNGSAISYGSDGETGITSVYSQTRI